MKAKDRSRRLWMPASSYYILAFALAAIFFFLAWGVLRDGGVETPWLTAGVGSSFLIVGSVLLREVVLRRARRRGLEGEVPVPRAGDLASQGKLTIEGNRLLLKEIKKRSDAANVLDRFSAGHKQVFELCSEYLNLIEDELGRMNPGSPRLEPLLKGRSRAAEAHRFHMLRWAEIEATELTLKAQSADAAAAKVRSAEDALSVVETALAAYPGERALTESRGLLSELVVSIGVNDYVERAERSEAEGDLATAKGFYRDALHVLARDNVRTEERSAAAAHINEQIDRIVARQGN